MNDDTGEASLRRYERCSGSSGMISTLLLAIHRGTIIMIDHQGKKAIAVEYPQPWPIVTSWTLPFSDAFFLPGLASSHAHDVNYQLKFILVNENYSGLSSIIDEF